MPDATTIQLDLQVSLLLSTSHVVLSTLLWCSCGQYVRYVGEHVPNGNWYCPLCGKWIPYIDAAAQTIKVWKLAQKVTDPMVLLPNEA